MMQSPRVPRSTVPRSASLLAAILLGATASVHAQKATKGPVLPAGTSVVSDSVRKTGRIITAGWREYAADGAWRRVYQVRDEASGATMVVFGDGVPGRRTASVSRFSYSARSAKGVLIQHDEIVSTADASPAILAQAGRSSPVPAGIAQRIRGLGGELGEVQSLADISKRMKDIGTAFEAAGPKGTSLNPADGFVGRGPSGGPGWKDPRGGLGRDGRASDGPKGGKLVESTTGYNEDKTNVSVSQTREYSGGGRATTTVTVERDGSAASGSSVGTNSAGEVTGGASFSAERDGAASSTSYTRDVRTGVITFTPTRWDASGNKTTVTGTDPRRSPGETGSRSRFEVELAQFVPWLADAYYAQWKRETALLISGGRITQPGGAPTLVLNEGPEVGVTGVVNCGDSSTNPCNRVGGVAVDVKGKLGGLSQPNRGVGGPPIGGRDTPRPMPKPDPQP